MSAPAAGGGMRVVLASARADDFALLHEICQAAGHAPVAYAYSRGMRPGQSAGVYAVRMVIGVVEALPSGMDLLLPAGPASRPPPMPPAAPSRLSSSGSDTPAPYELNPRYTP